MAELSMTYELPRDMMTEAGVLGEILTTGRVAKVADQLHDDTFYGSLHTEVARSVRALFNDGGMVSYPTVRTDMQRRGVRFDETELAYIANQSTDGLAEQLAYLNDLAVRRRIATGAVEVLTKVRKLDVPVDEVLAAVARMKTADDEGGGKDAGLRDIMDEAEAIIDANRSGATDAAGTLTGFPFFDDKGGLRKGTLTVIGGATSNGKTSFAMSIVKHAVQAGEHIGVFSLEMQGVELGQRMIATESRVENYKVAAKALGGYELTNVWDAIRRIREWTGDVHIDRRKVATIGDILESAARMVRLYGVKGIVVDFIQIIDLGGRRGESEEAKIAEVTRQLKLFALQHGVWVIALSQLNRDGDSGEPDINRMRGSGRIGENADNVLLIYRPEAYPDGGGRYKGAWEGCEHGTAEVIMPKGRNMGVGKYIVAFDAATTDVKPIYDVTPYRRMPL